MRAVRIHEFSGRLQVDEIPDPIPAEGEVLVTMMYASVNPLDVWTCQGNFAAITRLPHTPGVEGLGTVGGRIVLLRGQGLGIGRPGTYAERIAVPANACLDVPAGVDPLQAASLGVAGLTAWRAVHDKGEVAAGDVVLVLGSSGGVGSLAVQLAKAAGARVLGQTSNADKSAAIVASGADRVVVATDGAALTRALEGEAPDVVIDGLGGGFVRTAIDAIAPGGRYVNYGTSAGTDVGFDMRVLYRKGATLLGYTGLRDADATDAYAALFAEVVAGSLKMAIDAVLPFANADDAHRRILDRSVVGKLLLDCAAT
jgi:NADPH:quinone reductase